jgi:hypothetical protein
MNNERKSGNLFRLILFDQVLCRLSILLEGFIRPRDVIVYFNEIRTCHKPNLSGLYTTNELYEANREASQLFIMTD